jgi:hypothetical protein
MPLTLVPARAEAGTPPRARAARIPLAAFVCVGGGGADCRPCAPSGGHRQHAAVGRQRARGQRLPTVLPGIAFSVPEQAGISATCIRAAPC